MKILHVCQRYYPVRGGVEWHVKNVSERLARSHDVTVCTTDPSGKLPQFEIIEGVKVRRFKAWAPNEAYYFSRDLKRYLMENADKFDIVHAHNYHALPSLYAAQATNETPLIFTPRYHGKGHTFFRNLLHKIYRRFAAEIFKKADKIICLSRFERALILSNFRVDKNKLIIIPNGINKQEFNYFKCKKNGYLKKILCVSRLEKYKGIQYLIKAIAKLGDEFYLDIVGNGPFRSDLVRLISKLRLQNRVSLHQDLPRGKLLELYFNADLFVLLSQYEAFGNVVAEALASGVPCIVSDSTALRDWIDNENCFGISYPINIDLLAELIYKVAGRRVSNVDLLDWDDVVKKLESLYQETLAFY